ncbi:MULTISPECIES: gliding motility-associated C-terminal domain-containing protein [unclassified Carboxylicivirga]|uniref:gliding motility-associated C-terminal domain-containing protein n=1 Tax=Carboxylicivirga TaxID=1628153 RepID=UPI003D358087
MKKYRVLFVLLICWVGVALSYGQVAKPTLTVTPSETHFCESGTTTFEIEFTGSGVFDFRYEVDKDGDGVFEQRSEPTFNGYLFRPVLAFPFTGNGAFKVSYVYDDNYRIEDGVPGILIDGRTGEEFDGIINIIVDKKPGPASISQLRNCDLDVHLNALPNFETSTGRWRLENPADGTLDDAGLLSPIFTAIAEGSYHLTFIEQQGVCTTETPMVVEAIDNPSPSGGPVSAMDTTCSGTPASIELEVEGSFPITVAWSEGVRTFQQAPFQLLTPELQNHQRFEVYTYTDKEGCVSEINQVVEIQVDRTPFANALSFSTPICDSKATLQANYTAGIESTGFWTLVDDHQGSGIKVDNPSAAQTEIALNYGDQLAREQYDFIWTEINSDNKECVDSDRVTINFHKPPESKIISEETEFYFKKNISLTASDITEGMEGLWTIEEAPSTSTHLVRPNSPETTVEGMEMGEYTFRWTVSNGICASDWDEHSLTNNDIFHTTGFSPNGDGINDTFIIGGAENVTNNKLMVFDVTGQVVYQVHDFMKTDDTLLGWDGLRNDGEIEDGTYYYVFTGDEIEPVKNYLIIKGSKP